MMHDTRIVARSGPHEVLAQRHEITFRDGSTIGLHPVLAHGVPALLMRALATDSGGWLLFDLDRLRLPTRLPLGAELRAMPLRDQVGLVFFALRLAYPTKAAAVVAIRAIGDTEILPAPGVMEVSA